MFSKILAVLRVPKRISLARRSLVQTPERVDLISAFDNPSVARKSKSGATTGLLAFKELVSHEGFDTLANDVIKNGNRLLNEAIKAKNNPTACLELCDELSDEICKIADMSECIRMLHPDAAYKESATRACVNISNFVEKLNTNFDLYETIKKIATDSHLESDTLRLAELLIVDFEQSGIHLDAEKRAQAVALNSRALSHAIAFGEGCAKPKNDANDRESVYSTRDADQIYLLKQLAISRHQLARLCGFPSFAERTLRGGSSMVGGCARAREFLTLAARQLKSEVERAALATGQRSDSAQNLNDFMSNGQLQWFSRRRYSLGTCVDGLSRLFSHLYGIRLHVKEAGNGEVWSDDVVKVGVAHEREGELGAIYCDLIGREEKWAAHDCHFTLRGGRRLASGAYQNPLVVLTCNFPRGDPVTYLSSSQMGTLFHEMGHAMHSMLARARYQHVTGTRCATDLAEVPSHLMELFARDERVLRLFARDDVARRAATKENHIDTQLQIIYALTDLQLHDENVNDDVNPIDIYHQNLKEYFPLNVKDVENRIQYFSHFSHYGARYYSYLWARAVSNLLWKRLFSADPLSRKAGESYRREFLSHGGAKDPREILADTLGYEPTMKELVESLIDDVTELGTV